VDNFASSKHEIAGNSRLPVGIRNDFANVLARNAFPDDIFDAPVATLSNLAPFTPQLSTETPEYRNGLRSGDTPGDLIPQAT
jgi:hypothetical protein